MNKIVLLQTTKEFRILCELLYLTPEQALQFYIDALTPVTHGTAIPPEQAIAELLLLKTAKNRLPCAALQH